jgi:hypothetical protein
MHQHAAHLRQFVFRRQKVYVAMAQTDDLERSLELGSARE